MWEKYKKIIRFYDRADPLLRAAEDVYQGFSYNILNSINKRGDAILPTKSDLYQRMETNDKCLHLAYISMFCPIYQLQKFFMSLTQNSILIMR